MPILLLVGCVLLSNQIYFDNSTIYNTTRIYLINVLWKLGLGFRLDSELHYFSLFHSA